MDETRPDQKLPGLEFEPDELCVLESLEQVRAVATPLRVQILDCLGARALTVREVGQALEINSTKLYYHVGELERVGLVKLVDTDVQSGIQQKYYRSAAHYYFLSPDLLRGSRSEEDASVGASFMTSQLDTAARELRSAYLEGSIRQSPEIFVLSRRELKVSAECARELKRRVEEIDRLAAKQDNPEGECALELVMSVFPRRIANNLTE